MRKIKREWKNRAFVFLGGIAAVGCLCFGGIRVQAAQAGTDTETDTETDEGMALNLADMIGSTDDIAGGTVTPQLVYAEEEDMLRLRFQSIGYPERYYTATAFKNVNMELEGYEGVEFHVVNHLKSPVRMNFAFSGTNGRTAAAGNGYYVRLKGEESEYAKVEYGCFELPADFDGIVEIPFDVLKFQETSTNATTLNSIWGYGFIFVVQQDERYDVELSELRLLTPQESIGAQTPGALMIVGEDRALRSNYGESQTVYRCEIYNMLGESQETEAEFFMVGDVGVEEGENTAGKTAWISKDGVLTVDYRCEANVLEIGARTPDGNVAYKQVELYESWTNISSTGNGYNASIARPGQIEPIIMNKDIFENPKFVWRIREILVASAVIFMLYYFRARSKSRRR